MQINTIQRNIEKNGIENSTKMQISASEEVQDHIIRLLTENGYKKPIPSLIREVFCNAYDGQIANQTPNHPIIVRLYKEDRGNYVYEVSDQGIGMTEDDFYKYCMNIGESTKRNSNTMIGAMGAGFKSPLAYSNSFEVIIKKNFKEIKFLIYKGETRPESTKIYKKNTIENNGVTIRVPVLNSDFYKFKEGIKEQLAYFPTAFIQIDDDDFNYQNAKIFSNNLFEWSEIYPNDEMHISFGGVNYPIEWSTIDIPPIYLNIAIKIELKENICPIFNRESLIYTEETKKLILNKIKQCCSWFVNKYNEENTKEFDTIREIFEQLENDSKYITIEGKSFNVKDIAKYSDKQLVDWKVKGYSDIQPLKWFTQRKSDLFEEFQQISKYNGRSWKSKKLYDNRFSNFIDSSYQFIILDAAPNIHLKAYLINKFPRKELIILKESKKRKLFGNSNSYMDTCRLYNFSKDKWRTIIKDWQRFENEFVSTIPNFVGVQETPEFIKFVEEYKADQKANRNTYSYSGKHKVLNKQKGEVTLSICRKKANGYGNMFEKHTKSLDTLKKENKLWVYFTEESDKELASNLYSLFGNHIKVVFALKSEIKYLTNFHQFKTYQQFMDTQVFKRKMSAQIYKKLLKKYEDISKARIEILENILKPLADDIIKLEKYCSNNNIFIKDNELLISMEAVAKEHNLFDYSLWDVYKKVEKELNKYSFISMLEIPGYWDEDRKKDYKKVVNQLLYHNLITNKQLPENMEFQFVEKTTIEQEEPEEIMA